MKTLYISIIALVGISMSSFSQEKSRKELQGDKYSFSYSYEKAINSYTHAKKLSLEGQRHLGESYQLLNRNVEAEIVYSKLILSNEGVLPIDYYNYAMILEKNAKYEDAKREMDKFAVLSPTDLRAQSYTNTKAELNQLLKDDGKHKIEHLNINTDAQDFGASYYKNKIVFTSTRAENKIIKRKDNWNGKPFLDIYMCEIDGSQLKNPEVFDKNINGKMHDGPTSFSNDGTYMAFTKSHYKDKSKDKIVELQIWFSNYTNEKWSEPTPFKINDTKYSVGQPCLTSDGKTMYFTCDMPGGFGGADIYKVTKEEKGEWGNPENLGNKVNTEGDEVFPFFAENNKILFFSSNGHFGLGGLDIFSCTVNGLNVGKITNAGFPLNTQYDDFSIIIDKTNKGYFSSNRVGGSGTDDIYSIELLKGLKTGKKIMGIAKDKNEKSIPRTFITLLDYENNVVDTLTTKDDGAYAFFVDSDKKFTLNGKEKNHIEGNTVANTQGKEFVVNVDVVLLDKEEVVIKKIEVGNDLGKIVEFKPIYFDYHEYNIRPDAETELNKIVKIMNEYPNMTIELNSHTDCRSTKKYNQTLSNKRAIASVNYIKKRISKPERISGKGYGETKLINGCDCDGNTVSKCSEEAHQQNRRTEFIIIKK